MKTLRVCLYNELPITSERDPNYLYFAYDMLYLFSGQNYLEDNYAIVDSMPDDPVYGMLYIFSSDGSVHRIIDYSDTKIAEIEDPAQIEILNKAGTMFYVNAQHRYLDSQKRTITIPFTDGIYELNVSTKKDTIYDDNTILKYNTKTGKFEIYSDTSEEFIDYSKPFRGATTDSVKIDVNSSRITGSVRISDSEENALKLSKDGLFVKSINSVDQDEFNEWTSQVSDIKTTCENILNNITKDLEVMEEIITPEYIESTIYAVLNSKFGDIETAINNYAQYVDELDELEDKIVTYATNTVVGAREEIINKVDSFQTVLELDNSAETYTNEINYYDRAKEYYNPSIPEDTRVILFAALSAYLKDHPEEV